MDLIVLSSELCKMTSISSLESLDLQFEASRQYGTNSAASDILILSRPQQRRAWDDLHRLAVSQYLPPGFSTSIEWVLPNSVRIEPVKRKARRDVPALKPYDFAIAHNTLVIVNPSDR